MTWNNACASLFCRKACSGTSVSDDFAAHTSQVPICREGILKHSPNNALNAGPFVSRIKGCVMLELTTGLSQCILLLYLIFTGTMGYLWISQCTHLTSTHSASSNVSRWTRVGQFESTIAQRLPPWYLTSTLYVCPRPCCLPPPSGVALPLGSGKWRRWHRGIRPSDQVFQHFCLALGLVFQLVKLLPVHCPLLLLHGAYLPHQCLHRPPGSWNWHCPAGQLGTTVIHVSINSPINTWTQLFRVLFKLMLPASSHCSFLCNFLWCSSFISAPLPSPRSRRASEIGEAWLDDCRKPHCILSRLLQKTCQEDKKDLALVLLFLLSFVFHSAVQIHY